MLADKLRLEVGDVLTVPSSEGSADLEVAGIISLSAVTGLDEILVPLATAQTIFNLPDQINTIDILIKSGVERDSVSAAILQKIGLTIKAVRLKWVKNYLQP
jgi:ABC-type lipoprotein release transport system permease subunit